MVHAENMIGVAVGENRSIQGRYGLCPDRIESEPAVPEGAGIDNDQTLWGITKDRIGESTIKPGIPGHFFQTVGRAERMVLKGTDVTFP